MRNSERNGVGFIGTSKSFMEHTGKMEYVLFAEMN